MKNQSSTYPLRLPRSLKQEVERLVVGTRAALGEKLRCVHCRQQLRYRGRH